MLLPLIAHSQTVYKHNYRALHPRSLHAAGKTSHLQNAGPVKPAPLRKHRNKSVQQTAQARTSSNADAGHKNNGQSTAPTQNVPMPSPAPPAQTPRITPPMPDSVPIITFFNQDTTDWMRTGQTVYVTMQGTPGGQATFRVGTLSGNVVMREASPGQYLGSWVVPIGKSFPTTPFNIVGELRAHNKIAEPMPASRPIKIDTLSPTIANTTPQSDTSAFGVITADLHDEGSGIDIASLHLRLNGREVTGSAQITADHIRYVPMMAMDAGEQTVEIEVADRAGNKTMQTWHFTVKP